MVHADPVVGGLGDKERGRVGQQNQHTWRCHTVPIAATRTLIEKLSPVILCSRSHYGCKFGPEMEKRGRKSLGIVQLLRFVTY
jgi:hypothetical protein